MAANNNVILQWNCCGLLSKRVDLEILISDFSPAVICLQETLLPKEIENKKENELQSKYKFRGYKGYFKCINSGRNGVATFVKNHIPHHLKKLKTSLQALAISLTFQGKEFIVSNHYISDKHDSLTVGQLNYIVHQFDKPYIMVGDFNAKHELWSEDINDPRGRILDDFIRKNDLGLLNSDIPTRFDSVKKKWHLLDLSLVHPALYLDFETNILHDPHHSDHNPIIITLNGDLTEPEKQPRWNFKRANWDSFKVQCRDELNENTFEYEGDAMESFTTKLTKIIEKHIPKTKPFHKKCSKPWFDDDCKAAKRERNKANRLNRRYPCLDNHIKAKIANARARRVFKKKKKESWQKYVSSINSRTPPKKIWNMISKITGKNIPSHVLHLKDKSSGELITNKKDIATKIGSTFQKNSSSSNYSDDFKNIKKKEESKELNFSTKEKLPYNRKFKLRDLKRSLKKSKDSSPGPDGIHYKILKNLPTDTLKLLLNLINEYWDSQTFPDTWRVATLLPIPKPGKDPQDPSNFRPIALTSCICKTVERMVNERLIYFLESNNLLTKFQAGFRSERGTIDQLVRLDTFIRDAFINKEHVVGVFFDLSKAYDTTWKYGIMKDLHKLGLRGNLPIFIQNFLTERTFNILLLGTLYSDTFDQEEGVPQGAILSTTLFNVKLNDIARGLPQGVQCSLYVDDFIIFYRTKSSLTAERILQKAIDHVVKWTTENGFTVSPTKTVGMHFCKRNQIFCADPVLTLKGQNINFVTEHKFLGLIWDSRLTFRAHINYLKEKCRKAMNIIKITSHSSWGSDTKTLLTLFRSLIRSKLDYGLAVYGNVSKESLEPLNVLHRQGLRLCLGAFKSSPKESLYVESNEPPLELRRKDLLMRYGLKIKSHPENPTHNSLFDLRYGDKYGREEIKSLGESLRRLFSEAHVRPGRIASAKLPDVPIWQSEDNDVCFDLCAYDKSTTTPSFFKSKFASEIIPKYNNYRHIYTDGSKANNLAAYGISSLAQRRSKRINNDSSIFTAEMEAIKFLLRSIKYKKTFGNKFVIFCDSKSVLECIDIQESKNPIMIEILDLLQILKDRNIDIKFCWIPSHVGIRGNERADQLAKDGLKTNLEPSDFYVPYTDYFPNVKTYIKNEWQKRWDKKHNEDRVIKLHYILPIIKPFYINTLCRKDEVIIHRLRIGHTRLTHRHLMEDRPDPLCNYCNQDALTVHHILIDCQHFAFIRSRYYTATSLRDLFERFSFKHIIEFLKQAGLYKLI